MGVASSTASDLGTEVSTETVNTALLSHVKLVGNSSSSNVEPVLVVRGEILVGSSLNNSDPLYLYNLILDRFGKKIGTLF